MKLLPSLLLGALTLTLAGISSAEPVNEWLVLKEMRSVVHIVGKYQTPNGFFLSSCSGTWIGTRHIITANHCLKSQNNGLIGEKMETGTLIEGRYDTVFTIADNSFAGGIARVAGNETCDLMVIRAEDVVADHPIVSLRKTDLKIGERVSTIGHPGQILFAHTFGELSRLNVALTDPTKQFFNLINITIGHGNSGGPLFDEWGRLAGVSSAIFETGEAKFGVFSGRLCLSTMIDAAKKVEKEHDIEW